MTARSQRALALATGGVLALLFSVCAAVQVAGWTIGAVEQTRHQVIPGPVDKLSVNAGEGDVTVVRELSDAPYVTIDSTVKGSIHAPVLRAVKDGATVRIDGNCPYITFGPCRARIVIRVPAATEVDVRSGSGDVTASGLTGRVELETGSGDVNADALSGQADLHTSSGDVNVRGLSGDAELRTGSGDVNASFRQAPRNVDASTASGDVGVLVPEGEAYRVEADSGSGEQALDVRTDPASTRIIRAQTSSGDVTVAYGN